MRSLSHAVLSFGIGLGGITASGPGRAEGAGAGPSKAPPAPSVEAPLAQGGDAALRTVEARRRYQEGNAAMKLRQWQKAHDAYLAAWTQRPHWQVAGSLGQVELKLGRHRDAALHLALFLRDARDVPPEEMKHVREWLEQARAKVSVVTIGGAPSGTEIFIDGLKVGQAPFQEELYVEPGKHVVAGRLGSCTATSEVELVAGGSRDVALRCAAPEPARPGQVIASPALVPANESLDARRASSRSTALLIAGSSVTVAALGLGITSVAMFTARGNQAKENHETSSGPNATAEASFKNVAVWSFVVAGIAGGSTIFYQMNREKSSRPPVQGSLFVGPTGGAAVLSGEF
jgi:hypothetical protein